MRVLECDKVAHDVVDGGAATTAELEAVAVTFEWGEVPAVVAVAPSVGILDPSYASAIYATENKEPRPT